MFNKKLSDLSSEELEYNRSVSQITLLAVIVSLVLAFLYWVLRFGFNDNSILDIAKTLSVGFCLLILPDYIYRYVEFKKAETNRAESWTHSIAFISVLVLSFLVILGLFSLFTGVKIIYLLLPLGFILLILFLSDYFINFKKRNVLLIILFFFFSFWVGALIWGAKYHNPLFYEQIILGLAHPDTLFYTAVSNLIKTYGFPSTGLDGLPYLHFHWGGMWLFSYLSEAISVSVIKFYNLCYPVIFIPFYFKSLLLFIVDFKRYKKFSANLGLLSFILLFIIYVGRNTFSDLGNEAYLMAVAFAFLLFSIIISALRNFNNAASRVIHDKLFFYALLPAFIGVIGLCKISVGFLLIGLYAYLFLRMKWYKNIRILASFIISSLIFAAVYLAASNKGAIVGYNNLSQIIEYIKTWNLFFSIDYLLMWIFVFFILLQKKIYTLYDLKIAFKEKRILEIEVFLVIALLGLLPGAILHIDGGSDWYFSNFQKLLGLSFVLAYLSYYIKGKQEPFFSYFGKLKIYFVFIIFLIIISEILFINHYFIQGSGLFGKNIILRIKMLNQADVDFKAKEFVKEKFQGNGIFGTLKSIIPASKFSQQFLSQQQNYELVKALEKLGEMDLAEKRKTCIYIPKSNKIFWEMKIYKDYSHVRPFVVTTLTGMAMIDGLPEGELPDIRDYYYYKKARSLSGGEVTYDNIENIKSAANAKGFSNVIIIKEENGGLIVEKI